MKLPRRDFLHLAAGAAALSLFSLSASIAPKAWSQTARTIKIVVPFAPGGGADILARLLAEQIGRVQGVRMLVENRPGAGTVIATEAVSRAAPDETTLLLNTPEFVINSHLRKLNYDVLTNFEPICYLVNIPQIIAVNSASPYRTLTDLLNAARAQPGHLTLASVGPASSPHIAFEELKRLAKVNMIYVPFPGAAPAVNAALGEHVTSVFATYPAVVEQLKAGKLRALATASLTRIAPLPDLPTVAEAGYKDYEANIWEGVVAPASTPRETLSQLADWFTSALQSPDIKPKLIVQGFFPDGRCRAEFAGHIRKQYAHYDRVIREANIKAE